MSENSKTTQNVKILEHLKQGKSITPYEALYLYNSMRLPSRIYDLRKQGHNIRRQMVVVKNKEGKKCRVARYWMEE
jgi:hypothetical protein